MFVHSFLFVDTDKANDTDINEVIGKLPPNDLIRLYHGLEIEDDDIDIAKGSNRADVEEKARRVFSMVKREHPEKYTLEKILAGLEKAKNIDHMEKLDAKWKREAEGD